jgi:hypothetical protein
MEGRELEGSEKEREKGKEGGEEGRGERGGGIYVRG